MGLLLVLATHVSRKNAECWPSVRLLANESRLSTKSVVVHLELAEKEGWIKKKFACNDRMKYAGQVYTLTLPGVERPSTVDRGGSGERPSPLRPTYPQKPSAGTASGEASGEPDAAGVERRSESVEAEICRPLNAEANSSQTVNEHINKQVLNRTALNFHSLEGGTDKKCETAKNAEQWAQELGITRRDGEQESTYNLRVIRAMLQRRGPRNTSNVGEASQGSPMEATLGELDTVN